MQNTQKKQLGTLAVFTAAICTILGAILFLRFGKGIGEVGFWGIIIIILLGHIVTIPTAMSLSEIATNSKVEGGGEYYIMSRSFGLNIGATIGITLFLSQAISVAFYVIAFTETFTPILDKYGLSDYKQIVSVPVMLLLSGLMLTKGANIGMKVLYVVAIILLISLGLFFMGTTEFSREGLADFAFRIDNPKMLFIQFGIIFPAFTGMTAGVGLSGDLKNPSRSIPLGTMLATVVGMVIYFLVSWKMFSSATTHDLINNQLIMTQIAIGGMIIIPLGLASSTLSSALGSIMVAPRSLQAIASDRSFPLRKLNWWLAKGKGLTNEPRNASLVTVIIALVFVIIGGVDKVAQIISMFFLITYGSLNLISFLNHFGASPSYRPRFRSHWIISLIGFLASFLLMFRMSFKYSIIAIILITILYKAISHIHKDRKGMASLFKDTFFQLNRWMQVNIQSKLIFQGKSNSWRPSVVCIADNDLIDSHAFDITSWISYKYGFGSYIQLIQDFFSKDTYHSSLEVKKNLLIMAQEKQHFMYIDTLISPSYTSAIAQIIQLPGVSGMENNMFIFAFDRKTTKVSQIQENFALVRAGQKDICIFGSSHRPIGHRLPIHVWLKSADNKNSNLMILLSFIISSHPSWKKSKIKIFRIVEPGESEDVQNTFQGFIQAGRLPISSSNIKILERDPEKSVKKLISEHSSEAGLTILGINEDTVKHNLETALNGYDDMGDILWVNSLFHKDIE